METTVFMLATIAVQGGLVLLLMWVLTVGDREAHLLEEARRRLAPPAAEPERPSKAA